MRGRVTVDGCEVRAPGFEQLGSQELKGLAVVDVVPGGEQDGLEVGLLAALEGLLADGRGAPGDAVEGFGVSLFEADEVVSAVVRGAEDDAVAGLGEGFDGL